MKIDAQFLAILFGVLFAISEALGAFPSIQQNAVYQLVLKILAVLAGKKNDENK